MKEIEILVSPNLELINGILLTSQYNAITRPYVGYGLMTEEENVYTSAVKAFFKPYREHRVYKTLEAMVPNGFTFSRPVEFALSLGESEDFPFRFSPSPLCIAYSGGLKKLQELAALLRELAKESGYFDFYQTQATFYTPYIQQARETVCAHPFISMLEAEFGTQQHAYYYVISALMKGNFGLHFPCGERSESELFSVFSTDSLSLSPAILLHEYMHAFINPLTEKYRSLVCAFQSAYQWLSKYKLPDYQSGYGDWEECVNEHLVRAMTIHLLHRCGYSDLAQKMLRNDLYCGYQYIPLLLERYCIYDANRGKYSDFERYYPELLQVFSAPPEQDSVLRSIDKTKK